jgi:hypothetical protein
MWLFDQDTIKKKENRMDNCFSRRSAIDVAIGWLLTESSYPCFSQVR